MKRGAAGDRRYVGVSKRLTRARELRKPAAIARLGGAGMNEWVEDENGTRTLVPGDWRATDAYLKHHADGTKGNIVLRKLRAEAEEAELRVAAIREARKSGGAAGVVLWQALDALPEPMRSAVRAQLEASGYQMLAPRDLGGEPSDEDVARFCMSRETEGE